MTRSCIDTYSLKEKECLFHSVYVYSYIIYFTKNYKNPIRCVAQQNQLKTRYQYVLASLNTSKT